jgi:SAM-dependent methyltransferase
MTEQPNSANVERAGALGLREGGASKQPATGAATTKSRITYLTESMPVSMGDWWFDIANSEHFWIRRRFEVMRKLADPVLRNCRYAGEIGCGNGLLQRDIEDHYGKPVTGFELNQLALEKNISRSSPLYYYNVHQRNPEFHSRFDLLLLFDVLEHIADESEFLQSVGFHLAESGTLLINVPAHSFLRSDYDVAQGHFRRYSIGHLKEVSSRNGFEVQAFTYWGLPLIPLLLVRKTMNMERSDGRAGFDVRGKTLNSLLSLLAGLEPLPQQWAGTSVMAALRKQR